VVFDRCAIDRECGAASERGRSSRARRARAPPIDAMRRRGAQVVAAIIPLHSRQAIPQIPQIITNAANGNYAALQQLVRDNLGPSRSTGPAPVGVVRRRCRSRIRSASPRRSPHLGPGIDEGTATPAICRAWNVAPAPAIENEPVKSDVPVLIFAGEFDPDTPPLWGRRLLDSMPNARFVEMRGRSHGAAFNACGAEITLAFLRAPRSPLAVDCALK
jgi:pimeloyl-ACP methyl ester carboxylesterase